MNKQSKTLSELVAEENMKNENQILKDENARLRKFAEELKTLEIKDGKNRDYYRNRLIVAKISAREALEEPK